MEKPTKTASRSASAAAVSVPHLHRDRHGTWYFRITAGGRTIKRSLRTKLLALATMRAAALNWEWDAMTRAKEPSIEDITKAFADGRAKKFDIEFPDGTKITKIETDDDMRRVQAMFGEKIESIGMIPGGFTPTYDDAPRPSPARRHFRPGQKFQTSYAAYIKEVRKTRQNTEKTVLEKEATAKLFIGACGDLDTGEIDKGTAVAFKGKFMEDDAKGTGRINKLLSHMNVFFDWAIANGHAEANPFADLFLAKSTTAVDEKTENYQPFSAADLARIFDPKAYDPYATKSKPHFRWVPFLLLYSGARPEEVASLRVDQVRHEGGVDYFEVLSGKSSNSLRKVPLHRAVRESAFMDYLAERRRDDPHGQLFPQLIASKNGYCKNVSRRFNETLLDGLGILAPKRLYSFRATFITRMTELNANTAMLMAIVGHFEQSAIDLSSPHFKNYQGSKLVSALRDVVDIFDVEVPKL